MISAIAKLAKQKRYRSVSEALVFIIGALVNTAAADLVDPEAWKI